MTVTNDCGCRCSCCLQIVVALRKKNVLIYTVTDDKMILKKEIGTTEPALALVRRSLFTVTFVYVTILPEKSSWCRGWRVLLIFFVNFYRYMEVRVIFYHVTCVYVF